MKLTCLILFLFCCIHVRAQENRNVIIMIDKQLAVGTIEDLYVVAVKRDGSRKKIVASYYPGNLAISDSDYQMLKDTSVKTVYLAFSYREPRKHEFKYYNYEIDINKGWLVNHYYILYIYNTSKREFKRLYDPPPGKEYVYEFDYPGGGAKLLVKQR